MSAPVIANTLRPRAFFEHISENYKNEDWEFEKRLGFGGFGFTALKVNGASHIVSILAGSEDISGDNDDNDAKVAQTPVSGVFTGFAGIAGPAIALEYLEYGDLAGLANKIRRTERDVPNTILWSLLLCSSYNPQLSVKFYLFNAQVLEEIPSSQSRETESSMEHRDFNSRNIMLTVGDGPEHGIGVKAKLIDFGLADNGHLGSPKNIFDAGQWLDQELWDFLARCTDKDHLKRPSLQEALHITQNAVLSKTATSFPMPEMETERVVKAFIDELIFNVSQ
ncbi:hypothetical protein GQX73_g8175 [Xylaria multiplex]|uniref:Protein kinase domain-containing protein n=1 Tax=Xylaria multiplex TaxID=323545 RepID=A0A7C8IN67_9PEZI|nr:hypothetical protein GQX73_g8175 [Xylaria multiplex]